MNELKDHEYLGDGVYASFDGYYVHLHVGAHTNPPVVALEPELIDGVVKYYQRRVHQYSKPKTDTA